MQRPAKFRKGKDEEAIVEIKAELSASLRDAQMKEREKRRALSFLFFSGWRALRDALIQRAAKVKEKVCIRGSLKCKLKSCEASLFSRHNYFVH